MLFLFYILIGVLLFMSRYKEVSEIIYEKAYEISRYKPYSAEDLFKATMIVALVITMFTWPYWLIKYINK